MRLSSRVPILREDIMLVRALGVWGVLLMLAIANGAVRELAMIKSAGETLAHGVSSITLSAAILALTWFTIRWIGPQSPSDAWRIGALWVALTVAFEFLAGHYVFGTPWGRLWADYNVLQGRIWVVVLITTAIAPVLAARAHGLTLPQSAVLLAPRR
jgi:hypothetical protein